MKQLIIVRHAKTNIDAPTDFERTLTEKGHKEADEMAQKLLHEHIKLDAIISSNAVRALSTAKHFLKAYQHNGMLLNQSIIEAPELYNADVSTFFEVVEGLDDSIQSIALFSHNNGISEFAYKCSNYRNEIVPLPTCGMVGIQVNTESWQQFGTATKQFLFFYAPQKN